MKTIFCTAATVTLLLVLSPHAKALFGHTAVEKERRLHTEQQLARQEQSNGQLIHNNQHLHVVISVLSAGGIIMLIVGTAIGSKTRRDHENL